MLSFDIRTLGSEAAAVRADLPADDPVWADRDVRPESAVHVEGRLSAAGEGRFYFSGSLSGTAAGECRRCLTDVPITVNEPVQFLVVPTGDETADDDPDVYTYDPAARELDLRPAIREAWLLEVPAYVECGPDCKGLCTSCGADLNAGPCDCGAATDPRWDALRAVRDRPTA